MIYSDEYFQRLNGDCPGLAWKNGLPKKLQAKIDAKLENLRVYGLELINTEMLKPIKCPDADLYELRSGQCRLAVFYDRRQSTFVYLNGWLKKRRKQDKDILYARVLLQEYLKK